MAAGGDLAINASVNDGFFQFRDQTNPDYLSATVAHNNKTIIFLVGVDTSTAGFHGPAFSTANTTALTSTSTTLPAALYVPYNDAGNSAAPAMTGDPFGTAALFPLLPSGLATDSASLNLVAGADVTRPAAAMLLASANPVQVAPASAGVLTVSGSYTYSYGGSGAFVRYDATFNTTLSMGATASNYLSTTDTSATWQSDVTAKALTTSTYTANTAVAYGTSGQSGVLVANTPAAMKIDDPGDLINMTISITQGSTVGGIVASKGLTVANLRDIAKISDPTNPQYDAYLHTLYMSNASTPNADGDFFTVATAPSTFVPNPNPFTDASPAKIVASVKTAAYIFAKYIDPLFTGASGQSTATVTSLVRTGVGSINLAASGNIDLRTAQLPLTEQQMDKSPPRTTQAVINLEARRFTQPAIPPTLQRELLPIPTLVLLSRSIRPRFYNPEQISLPARLTHTAIRWLAPPPRPVLSGFSSQIQSMLKAAAISL